jgi:hypothetical protein
VPRDGRPKLVHLCLREDRLAASPPGAQGGLAPGCVQVDRPAHGPAMDSDDRRGVGHRAALFDELNGAQAQGVLLGLERAIHAQ